MIMGLACLKPNWTDILVIYKHSLELNNHFDTNKI